jgi:uncharacterized membrane protein HdeD (DUF308 family)
MMVLTKGAIMSNPNFNPENSGNQQNPQGQPEYGAYAPNQQYQQNQQYQDDAQTPRYFNGPYDYYVNYDTGQPVSPFRLVEEWLPKQAKNAVRAIYGVLGVAAVALGLALLIWPGATLRVAAITLGLYFIVSGVVRIVTAIVELGLPGGWRVLDILIGLLLSVGGVVMLKNATLSGATLAVLVTMVVGLGWMLEGVMALVESWRMPSSAWAVVYALISIIAGFVMLFSPVASAGWLILFGGFALVALGIVAIVRAFTFGKIRNK